MLAPEQAHQFCLALGMSSCIPMFCPFVHTLHSNHSLVATKYIGAMFVVYAVHAHAMSVKM